MDWFDVAAVVSSDTDRVEPIRMVSEGNGNVAGPDSVLCSASVSASSGTSASAPRARTLPLATAPAPPRTVALPPTSCVLPDRSARSPSVDLRTPSGVPYRHSWKSPLGSNTERSPRWTRLPVLVTPENGTLFELDCRSSSSAAENRHSGSRIWLACASGGRPLRRLSPMCALVSLSGCPVPVPVQSSLPAYSLTASRPRLSSEGAEE